MTGLFFIIATIEIACFGAIEIAFIAQLLRRTIS
jgi:hypothetical protein